MPRLRNRIPKLCLHKSSGQAYAKFNKVPKWFGAWGEPETEEAYDRYAAEWLANGRQPVARTDEPADEPATVTEIAVAYWKHAETRYDRGKASSIKLAIRVLRKHYGSTPADEFGPKRLRIVRKQMMRKGWSRGYINSQVGWLKRMFKWAASHELVSDRIHRRLQTVEGLREGEGGKEREPVTPVPQGDVRRIWSHLSTPVRGLVLLQSLTAARADELVRLRAIDIDTSSDVWKATLAKHKNAHRKKKRTLFFGPRAQRVLNVFMRPDRPVDKPLFSPKEAIAEAARRRGTRGRRPNQKPTPRKDGRRWANQYGKGDVGSPRTLGDAYTTPSYRKAIHDACNKAGIPVWGPHRLRHGAATRIRREHDVDTASIILGHSSLVVTQTYAEANEKKAIEVMRKSG